MATDPPQIPDDDGAVNSPPDPQPPFGGPGSRATNPGPIPDPDSAVNSSADEPTAADPGAVTPRVGDDVYDPRTRGNRTTLPGIDPPMSAP
jgi:hypothetical protein